MYGSTPTAINAGLPAAAASGAMGQVWIAFAILTVAMAVLAISSIVPRREV